jgi:signal transduction histidine kinase
MGSIRIRSKPCAALVIDCATMVENRSVRTSAAYRIAFTYSAVFLLAIVLLGVAVYFAANREFRRQQDASLVEETGELVGAYRSDGLAELRARVGLRQTGSVAQFGYALFDAAGRRETGSLDTTRPAAGLRDIVVVDPAEGANPARALVTTLADGRTLVVAVDPRALERIDGTILTMFGGALVIVIVLCLGGAVLLGGYLRWRLERIGATARAIVAGDLSQRVPVGTRGDEFDALAQSLNAMLDRIAQLLDSLRQVSSDVAHDLRTPLARLRGALEAMLDGPPDRGALKQALKQSDALLSLFAAILRISEVEGGALNPSFATVDITALTIDLCETYAPAIVDGGRTLTCAGGPAVHVRGDYELIAQALINLLDNAQAHTPPGSAIIVAVRIAGDRVDLSVSDNGPGVPVADRERIVHRFVRLERSRTTPGNGLGLNLVAAIAGAHRGTLEMTDAMPGLCATISLPMLKG